MASPASLPSRPRPQRSAHTQTSLPLKQILFTYFTSKVFSFVCLYPVIVFMSFHPEEQQFWVPQWEGPIRAQELWRRGLRRAEGHTRGICSKSNSPLCAWGFMCLFVYSSRFHSPRIHLVLNGDLIFFFVPHLYRYFHIFWPEVCPMWKKKSELEPRFFPTL